MFPWLFIIFVAIDICIFEEVNNSSNLYRPAWQAKPFTTQLVQRPWVGHLLLSVGWLAAKVLGQADLGPGPASGQTWCMDTQGPVWLCPWGGSGARPARDPGSQVPTWILCLQGKTGNLKPQKLPRPAEVSWCWNTPGAWWFRSHPRSWQLASTTESWDLGFMGIQWKPSITGAAWKPEFAKAHQAHRATGIGRYWGELEPDAKDTTWLHGSHLRP